ncbi:MAG: glycosyltransferase family 8 protein [Alphaproteobacteria bacterium]
MSSPSIAVAYVVDRRMLTGFLVSLRALGNFATRPIRVYVFLSTFSPGIVQLIERSARSSAPIELRLLPIPDMPFTGMKKLQDNNNTYAKFLIPKLIEEKYVIYLDCDTIPLIDIAQVPAIKIADAALGAVPTQKVKFCLDQQVLIERGIAKESEYFNAGVLMINAEAWRTNGISEICIETAQELGQRAISHDQTVLNLVFNDKFIPLDKKFNHIISQKSVVHPRHGNIGKILHFIGSPKPWEYLAKTLAPAASHWMELARELGHSPRRQFFPHSFGEAKNLLRLVRRTAANRKRFFA